MTIAFTALSGSRFKFWSRHVLLSGPKLQNTNCTDTFSTAVMRHKQQTSGRLWMANYTIVRCFFQIHLHAHGKGLISSIMSKFWWYAFHRQHKLPSSPEQRIFPLIFISTIRQIFCLPSLLLMHLWCQSFSSWILFEHSDFSLRLQSHSPITLDWSDLRDLNFDCIQCSGFRS